MQTIHDFHAFDSTKELTEIINRMNEILKTEKYIDMKWIEDDYFDPEEGGNRHFDVTVILITEIQASR